MKKFKLFLAAFVATLFAFAGVKASAYTLTIDHVADNHTYEAYQVFSGTLASDGKTLSDIQWGNGVTPFTFKDKSEAAEIAKAIEGQEVDSDDAKAFSKVAGANLTTPAASAESKDGQAVLTVAAPGYYLVKDKDGKQNDKYSAYTRFMMEVAGDVTARVKNDRPTVQKKVKETNDSTGTTTDWQDAADYDINDTVPFQLKATLPIHIDDYEHYYVEFTDTLSAGLTFDKITLVKADNTILKEDQYQVSKTENKDGTTTLSVIITDVKAVSGISKDDKEVTVEYNATLNDKAVLGSAGNPNSVELTYSNNPNATGDGTSKPADTGKTPKDTVKVFTYQTIINKLNENKEALKGAGFTLSKKDKDGNWNTVKAIAAGEATRFEFKGLDAGDYKLEETTTPDGYNTIKPIEFTIDAKYDVESADPQLTELSTNVTSGDVKSDDFKSNLSDGSLTVGIVNRKGSLLPSTGGMGTTILYVVGSILVLVAAILFITKKRMDAAK
ncbi:LPXTG-motif cell wall anchor domain-containing protein/fimbrial isopeptide formation D2 domain-containing protein [Streptococcus equinus]|uniref:LPXTG-motif cell wall anchor domain-containing protein/fimbrial isopeptide formation D2 domain-containing protein n=1 Tax=Streptococcus equinus TaxID=1335 RepID=A0A1H0ZSX2_STREI|nr:isopeptide-forming domain-containing fimbrial protein [Streptococcus equinus]SDQ30534.1 LPXTG-motif cell wall anchor domain-containing protein/fimbrial isopeptide formation D2 domain-containing protein [Streptococcus equinus]